jgi:prevent-host-death family protein
MKSIGVRELRQNASVYLRLVEAGETVRITDRGKPVALLVPVPESNYERMIREGRIIPAKNPGGLKDIEPRPPMPGKPPLSQVLREMREDERY